MIAALAMSLWSAPAGAERIVSSLSTHQVMINSSFTGLDIVLFGSVEREPSNPQRTGPYNLVVTVVGPREKLVTRRKGRILGIWMNVDSRSFIDVPSYLAVLSTRPFNAIADPEALNRLRIGLERTVLPQQIGPDVADVVRDDPFRQAFLRLREERKLYVEQTSGVTFLTPTVFRSSIPLPADIQTGNFDVDLKLFADGALIGQSSSAFEIEKVGFERFVAVSAQTHGVFYGFATAGMALLTGWFAFIVFRRD
jgi:uncharacterized protein (TIGR02186 family)